MGGGGGVKASDLMYSLFCGIELKLQCITFVLKDYSVRENNISRELGPGANCTHLLS